MLKTQTPPIYRPAPKSTKIVAIVGRAKETRELAPFGDEGVEIWMMNDWAMRSTKRVTATFEMHPDWYVRPDYEPDYKAWLQSEHDFPIYMHEVDPRVPASKEYPMRFAWLRLGGGLWKDDQEIELFSSSTPYALALAILHGYKRIELYGIELYDNGYRHQGDSIFYWIGQANARGVDVVIDGRSNLYKRQLYPMIGV